MHYTLFPIGYAQKGTRLVPPPKETRTSSTNKLVVAVKFMSTTDKSVHKVVLVSLTQSAFYPVCKQSECHVCRVYNFAHRDDGVRPGRTGRHCFAGPR